MAEKKHHTIILVPHARAKMRKWCVTNTQIGVALSLLVFLGLSSVLVSWFYFRASASPAQIAKLESENRDLRQANTSFEANLAKLQKQLAETEERTRQLAIVAGVDGLGEGGNGEAGVGGPDLGESPEDLPSIERRTGDLAGTLDRVEGLLEQRARWISSTPSIAPARGILTSGFGSRSDPLTHGRGNHEGIDISAPAGQPVVAPADGLVIQAGEMGGYGNTILVTHGFGITTRYGHLSRIGVKPGQRVRRGETIGRVGSTGRSTGDHLHYEVHVDGKPVNPIAYLLDQSNGS